jgi:hypothetical protein
VARLRRRRLKVIIAPIDVHDRKGRKLRIWNIVQTTHDHGNEPRTSGAGTSRKRLDSTVFAEQMLDTPGAELILGKRIRTAQQAEIPAADGNEPSSAFTAYRAVAFHSALAQVRVGFIANGPTVTAARVCLLHQFLLRLP